MRVPLSWLADYVDLDLTPEQLAERLTRPRAWRSRPSSAGAPTGRTSSSASSSRSPSTPTPTGCRSRRSAWATASRSSIVCGATNIAPGQRVPVALPGAVLPGGRRIDRTEKMGVVSNGMLCSGDELGLTSDADGILILPPETPIGRSSRSSTATRSSTWTSSRTAATRCAWSALPARSPRRPARRSASPTIELAERGEPTADRFSVEVLEPELCTRFVGRIVRGVHASVRRPTRSRCACRPPGCAR